MYTHTTFKFEWQRSRAESEKMLLFLDENVAQQPTKTKEKHSRRHAGVNFF